MSTLEEIKKALEGVTPGPWKWFGNASSNSVYLATTHSGRRYVMDFVRWGMKGAQPRFQPERGGMVDAKDLLQFEVGDRDIVGMDAAKKDGSVYRYDVRGIDCPDARYIAAVNPAAISELISTLESLQRENEELRKGNNHIAAEKSGIAKNAHSNVDYWKSQYEAAEAEVNRLQAEIDRKSSMPGDHRYWEGRYRDEAAENEKLREALTPFVLAFESRRETYSKRYRSNRQLGYANFDKMPDDWAMEKVAFNMGTSRCARKALSSAGRDPLREFDALVEGPSFTKIASTGGEHNAE
ncbi:hypothetical protein [Agrobacterium tumefaciens]|uniref:hypothetical protein n=1 Tax=Agrobacterium tumefaciens TaxID=358 RepID=UPI000B262F9B